MKNFWLDDNTHKITCLEKRYGMYMLLQKVQIYFKYLLQFSFFISVRLWWVWIRYVMRTHLSSNKPITYILLHTCDSFSAIIHDKNICMTASFYHIRYFFHVLWLVDLIWPCVSFEHVLAQSENASCGISNSKEYLLAPMMIDYWMGRIFCC